MTDNKDALEQRLEFKREPRYIVFKIKDLKAFCNASLQQEIFRAGEVISHGRDIEGKPIFNAVVVEQDWPEFEPTWAAIEARMIGKPPPLEQVLQQLQQLQTVEAEREGLKAAQAWQPIETAPQTGRMLLYIPGFNGDKVWTGLRADGWIAGGIYLNDHQQPTFWMPLPEGPIPGVHS